MKKLIFLLLFLPTLAVAQLREITLDTTVISKVGSAYFETHIITYSDGGPADQTVIAFADSVGMVSYYANKLVGMAAPVSSAAEVVIRRKSVAKLIRQLDAAVIALPAMSPLRAIQSSIQGSFLAGSWTISNGTTTPVTFSNNAQGVLRYTVTGSTAKTVEVLGPGWITLKNYPSAGTDTDLFQTKPKQWENIDKTIALKKP